MKACICETLQEVANAVADGQPARLTLRNFMAFLNTEGVQEAIQGAPAILADRLPRGLIMDAYLAAVAEWLAIRHGLETPTWAEAPDRFLGQLHFPSHNQRLNDLLLQETPEPFRRRGLVTSVNALEVA
jgi:hypothetical protein